jgi:hypothetical protein
VRGQAWSAASSVHDLPDGFDIQHPGTGFGVLDRFVEQAPKFGEPGLVLGVDGLAGYMRASPFLIAVRMRW